MSQNFINQVRSIVMSNITDETFGVGDLASQLDLSKSQTLRKIKAATGKSVNQYIREIRLQEAAKLIKESDFTAAEISFKVGFGSPSYFNKNTMDISSVSQGIYFVKVIDENGNIGSQKVVKN